MRFCQSSHAPAPNQPTPHTRPPPLPAQHKVFLLKQTKLAELEPKALRLNDFVLQQEDVRKWVARSAQLMGHLCALEPRLWARSEGGSCSVAHRAGVLGCVTPNSELGSQDCAYARLFCARTCQGIHANSTCVC